MKFKISIMEILLTAASVVLCAGSFTFFSACPVHSETIMACHWAQHAVTALGALLCALSVAALVVPDMRVKAGIELAAVCASVLTALVPTAVISLCMMTSMRCVSVFRPFTILFSSLAAVIALAAAVVNLRKSKKENKAV